LGGSLLSRYSRPRSALSLASSGGRSQTFFRPADTRNSPLPPLDRLPGRASHEREAEPIVDYGLCTSSFCALPVLANPKEIFWRLRRHFPPDLTLDSVLRFVRSWKSAKPSAIGGTLLRTKNQENQTRDIE
jgi:hypothetical protein